MLSLRIVVSKLEKIYGLPQPPKITDPGEMVLFETVAYLAPDVMREAAFEALRARVGTAPAEILAARRETLVEICRTGGIHADLRAERLREIAAIIHYHFHGDLSSVLKLPPNKAIKELTRLPSIAAPGAEKILLFTRTVPVLALESNGVRVLARIFFGEEQKNYASTYRAIREVVADQTGDDCDWLISTHQLLRQHGQECCTRNHPHCHSCPLSDDCRYASLRKAGE
jgi:endonuclease III